MSQVRDQSHVPGSLGKLGLMFGTHALLQHFLAPVASHFWPLGTQVKVWEGATLTG